MTDSTNNQADASNTPSHVAYQVRERKGQKGIFTRIGAAWPNKNGGFNIQLDAVPLYVAAQHPRRRGLSAAPFSDYPRLQGSASLNIPAQRNAAVGFGNGGGVPPLKAPDQPIAGWIGTSGLPALDWPPFPLFALYGRPWTR
jgi:hypothetical protein